MGRTSVQLLFSLIFNGPGGMSEGRVPSPRHICWKFTKQPYNATKSSHQTYLPSCVFNYVVLNQHKCLLTRQGAIQPCVLKTYAPISNAHLSRVCKRGKLSGSCLSTLNGFGSTQLPIFLCHIGVPTFSSQNN